MRDHFRRFACKAADWAGTPFAFGGACLLVIGWLVTGPMFQYSNTWQLVINTGTTIVTFLMVFLIQHAQNRDTIAIQLKLNELLRSVKGARNEFVDLEEMTDDELQRVLEEFRRMYMHLHKTVERRERKLKRHERETPAH